MDNRETYETYSAAAIAELNGAIAADGLTGTQIARQLGMDYNTLRRYLRNEREIPMIVLYGIIDQLTISEAELFAKARARFERQ